MTCDLIIRGGTIVSMDAGGSILEHHDILISGSKIEAILPTGSHAATSSRIIDASGCIVMPGLINAHTHLPMTYFRGLADDLPLARWLGDYIWPLEAKLIKHQFVFDATLHGAAEMIQSGICRANDMYFQMGAIAEACTEAGMRCHVSEAMIDHQSKGSRPPVGSKVMELQRLYQDNHLVDFSLAPHAIYTCGEETLRSVASFAKEHDILVHMHLSETEDEVSSCLAAHGMRPVQYLKETGILDCRCVFAHGVWCDESEMELLAEASASIAICTESNLKLASGIAPIALYQKHGVNLCLGTDGVASNNNLDLFSEMDFTAKLHKAINHDPSMLPAAELVQMATINAAKALGIASSAGSLEPGKLADIAIIDTLDLQSQPIYNPYSHLVYAVGRQSVRDVIIDGKILLDNRVLTQIDEAALITRAQDYRELVQKEL